AAIVCIPPPKTPPYCGAPAILPGAWLRIEGCCARYCARLCCACWVLCCICCCAAAFCCALSLLAPTGDSPKRNAHEFISSPDHMLQIVHVLRVRRSAN